MQLKNNLAKKTIIAMLAVLLVKLLGFIRTAIVASIYGATIETDAFYMATSIVIVFSGIACFGLNTALVPIRTKLLQNDSKEDADRYASTLLTLTIIIAILLTIASYMFTPNIVKLFAPNFVGEQFELTLLLVRVLLPMIIVSVVFSIVSGLLNAQHKYATVQFSGVPFNLFWIIIPLFLYTRLGIWAMVFGYIVGNVIHVLYVLPATNKIFKYRPNLALSGSAIKTTLLIAIPAFISSYAETISQSVDRGIASSLPSGSITALGYANQLIGLVNSIIVVSITTTLYTTLSENKSSGDIEKLKATLGHSCRLLTVLLVPITVICVMFNRDIISIVYERGSFDANAGMLTSKAFLFYSISLLAMGLYAVFLKCFFVIQSTVIPLVVTLAGMGLHIALSFMLVGALDVGGLALATSMSYIVQGLALIIMLRRKLGKLHLMQWFYDCLRVLAGTIVLTLVAWFVRGLVPYSGIINFAISCFASGMCYLVVLWWLRQKDIRNVVTQSLAYVNKYIR